MDGESPEPMVERIRAFEREKADLEGSLTRLGEESGRLERTVLQADIAGRTVRQLSAILDLPGVTPDRIRDLLPRFVNHVVWRREGKLRKGRLEIALFERPFRPAERVPLREAVEALGVPREAPEGGGPGQNGAGCGSGGPGFEVGSHMG
jgi:hypothetical protein